MADLPNDRRSELQIEEIPISSLKFASHNPRKHDDKQIGQIASSIAAFGFLVPPVVDRDNRVIVGEARCKAALRLDMKTIPVIRVEHLTEEQIRAFRIADNKLVLNSDWDDDLLRAELAELSAPDLDFDLSVTGFDFVEIDALLALDGSPEARDPLDELPPLETRGVNQEGDCWVWPSGHKLICGDATLTRAIEVLFKDEFLAQMVFDDPPYNVPINGHVSGLGKVRHREFVAGSGELTDEGFTAFLAAAFANCARWSAPGALQYHFMDWRHTRNVLAAAEGVYSSQLNMCVWAKTNAGLGSFYRSQIELVHVFKCGSAPHINNVQLGRNRRHRTNLWSYPGANSFGKSRSADLAMHPTVKPVTLLADAILDASEPGGIILDVFAGSGTTLVAAHKTRRRGFGIELDPLYCDLIVRRLETLTKAQAVLAETGETFAEVAARRAAAQTGDEA